MTSVNENQNLLPPSPPNVEENIIPGQFEYVKDNWTRDMLINAWQAINITETWDFVKQDIDSFMFSNDPRVSIIYNKMEELGYGGHSGASFGCTMRAMQYIATHGERKFMEEQLANSNN
jgi:nanoRNase/pAp phosphatase (c-di-AMP/oligoRNAs hydrolase)